jgi:hypothetical protein
MSDPAQRCERRDRRIGTSLCAATVLLLGLGGCASHKPPPVQTVKAPPPSPQKLAWMPLDAMAGPVVAKAVNDQMSHVQIAGTTLGVKAAVSMEVAQLAIECIQPTSDCYRAVGQSLGADRLLWAEIDPEAPKDKIRITIVLFDVRAGTASRQAATFDGEQAAGVGVAELLNHAVKASRSP